MIQLLGTPSDSTPLTPYTAVIVSPDGNVQVSVSLLAIDDDDALFQIRSVAKGHAVDLWEGLRFVEHVQTGNGLPTEVRGTFPAEKGACCPHCGNPQ